MKEILSRGIVQTERLNENSTFYLVSYYWGRGKLNKNSIASLTYDQQVDRLVDDCRRSGVNYYFVRYPQLEQGVSYQIALGLKPEFIEYCLKKLSGYKCIFVDTDLRVLKYPHLFDADVDCWFLNWNEYDYNCYNPLQLELPGGVMGFGNTHNAKMLLKILISKLDKRYAEDKTFSGVITRNFLNTFLRCIWLPETYMYMFSSHEYTPGVGYTKIASYKHEFKDNYYKQSDIVIAHEDFETGALEDVYNEKVGKSRWPPYVDKQLGEKLRCYNVKFINYRDWGLDKTQSNHVQQDISFRQDAKLVKMAHVPLLKDFVVPDISVYKDKRFSNGSFIVVSIIDNTTDTDTLETFVDHCKKLRVNFVIYMVKNTKKVNKPLLLVKVLRQHPNNNVVYMDIENPIKKRPELFYVKNMDFMTFNLNAEFQMSKCFDPRILKTLNDHVLFVANNKFTTQFLLIWASFNKSFFIKNNLQHKSLEYAFNVSNALNKLRCYWLPSGYTNTSHRSQKSNNSSALKKVKVLTKSLEQCGLKPPRNHYSEPTSTHYHGSKGKRGINKYGRLFLKFK